MPKVLLLHNTLVHEMIITKENRDLIALLIDQQTNHLIDVTLFTDIDHAHILEITFLQDTYLLLEHLQD